MADPLILAHFNSNELRNLDKAQGGRLENKEGLPVYTKLYHMIKKNPEMRDHLNELFELGKMHQKGQETHLSKRLNKLAADGIGGDTELALIPKKLSDMLDHVIGGVSRNPKDGYKQYFLGALAALAAPMLLQGGMAGMGTMIGSMGKKLSNSVQRPQAQSIQRPNAQANFAQNYTNQNMNNYQSSYSPYSQYNNYDDANYSGGYNPYYY